MPSQRPSAAFDPIPPDLDLPRLVEETPNFEYVTRISCEMIEEQGIESFDKLVLLHVILGGKPLVIEGYNFRLDKWTFTSQWLQDNCGKKFEQARNLNKRQNMALSIGHYLNNMSKLTDQWTPDNYKESDRQRIYLKDIDCPQIWHEKLKEQVPQSVFYLNESTGDIGGPGSVEGLPGSTNTKGQGVARAGDLMSCLPPPMRADNMMCYIGHEGTYTPAHREMCASLGQNLMVETSGLQDEFGKPTKPGSSIWFMTETSDRHMVSEYWLSTLGHDIEVENHFAQINAWKAAPFKTYIVDQRAGDFILIPPLAPHQVWNRGTRTMKAAWNRTTVETLEMALHEALPRARMVCRDEQYKNKAIVYFALEKYSGLLKGVESQKLSASPEVQLEIDYSPKIRQLQKDFRRLFSLYTEILLSEMLGPVSTAEKKGHFIPYDSFITCSYCRCNIFNRFLTCTSCIETLENGEENTYDICMDCFAMGRSCSCISKYKWVEQHHWKDLTQKHETWRSQIIAFDGGLNEKSPNSLDVEIKKLGRKTLTQVCQEQLKARPYQDPKKPLVAVTTREQRRPGGMKDYNEDEEVLVDSKGRPKKSKSKKTRADRLPKSWAIEHVSCYPLQQWKVAACTKCDRKYSYGSLYRMFDLMPQTVMENLEWECPACLKICSCGACRRKQGMMPYEPVGTVLGHDTKKVADPRSVESLVNSSLPNTNWIKVAGDDHPHESRRLSRRKDEAEKAKAKDPALDDNYVDEEEYAPLEGPYTSNGIMRTTKPDIPIDPMLSMDQPPRPVNSRPNGPEADSDYKDSPSRTQGASPDWDLSNRVIGRELTPPSQGLRSKHEHSNAPLANMAPQEHHAFTSNGISYEYPDPTLSQSTPPSRFLQLEQPRRRRSGANIIQSDLSEPVQSASNGQSQPTQFEQILEDAEENDCYISTEAAFTGKSLRIKLFISSSRLATAAGIDPRLPRISSSIQEVIKAPPILLQSDYTSASPAEQPNTSKKRRIRRENDDEFTTRKRRDRRSSANNPILATKKDTRHQPAKYTEISSDSDVSTQVETSPHVPINRPQAPRPLPKYLAQRNGDGQPTSLDETPLRKPSTPASQSQDAMINIDHHPTSDRPAEASTVPTNNDTIPCEDAPPAQPPPAPNPDTARGGVEEMELPMNPALKLAGDNRKAKLKALHWADDDDDSTSESDAPKEPVPAKKSKPNGNFMATPKSIFSRPGVNGKKVNIVSAKSASVNRKTASKAVEIARRSLGI